MAGTTSFQKVCWDVGTIYPGEWLAAQAASGFLRYDAGSESYELPPEQAAVLADDTSPVYLPGLFQVAASVFAMAPQITEGFRTGAGVGWHEHGAGLFEGVERFFRSGYRANLVPAWIPALEGVEAKLHAGMRVADVGCGHGASTILMAQAYPASTFVGYDYLRPRDVLRRPARHGRPASSTMICTPASLAQDGRMALGSQARP